MRPSVPESSRDRDSESATAVWLLPLLPALLAAAHLTGLLFFLNPDQPISWLRLARGTLLYGALFALPSVGIHRLVARWAGCRVARLLPWTLTAAVAAGALADWVHRSSYAYYLPPGINVQLIKTALWLTLGAIAIFYTALLHTLHDRRWGMRSRLLVLLVALGTVYAMFDRRTSFRPTDLPPRRAEVEVGVVPRLVVVELRSATLDALLPLAEQGQLPTFRDLFENGAATRLSAWQPALGPALQASWATAKLPWRHGIAGERVFDFPALGLARPLRLLPIGVGFERWGLPTAHARPVGAGELQALPIWEIVRRAGHSTRVIGFDAVLGGEPPDLPAPDERLRAEQALAQSGWDGLARSLGEDRRRLAAARAALGAPEAPEVVFVSLPGLESAARATFGGFVRAEFEGERAGALRRAADAYTTYLAGLDAELGALWDAMPEPRLLVVSSASGVSAGEGLSRFARDLLAVRRVEGSLDGPPDGVLVARGESVRRGLQLGGGHVVDVAPTLLYALGLPIARDFDGRVLAEIFEPALLQRRALAFLPSYERLPQQPPLSPSSPPE